MLNFQVGQLGEKVRALGERTAEEWFELGMAYDASVETFAGGGGGSLTSQATEASPDWGEAHINLGTTLYHLEQFDEAQGRSLWRRRPSSIPRTRLPYFDLGCARDKRGEIRAAVESFRAAAPSALRQDGRRAFWILRWRAKRSSATQTRAAAPGDLSWHAGRADPGADARARLAAERGEGAAGTRPGGAVPARPLDRAGSFPFRALSGQLPLASGASAKQATHRMDWAFFFRAQEAKRDQESEQRLQGHIQGRQEKPGRSVQVESGGGEAAAAGGILQVRCWLGRSPGGNASGRPFPTGAPMQHAMSERSADGAARSSRTRRRGRLPRRAVPALP